LAAERARGTVLSHRDWIAADTERARLRLRWRALFDQFDVVLCPVLSVPAFPHDHSDLPSRRLRVDGVDHDYFDHVAWAGMATAPGRPAAAPPTARPAEGLPTGAQAIGPLNEARPPLRFAELVEREFGGFTPPPLS